MPQSQREASRSGTIKITQPRTKRKVALHAKAPAESSRAAPDLPARTEFDAKNSRRKAGDGEGERASAQGTGDDRIPPAGTVLSRTVGTKRCQCTVEEGGFRYQGRLYGSLSAAASAAAQDDGLSPSQNGYVFWGLAKAVAAADVPSLKKLWEKYLSCATRALRTTAAAAVQKEARLHVAALSSLLSGGAARSAG
jgi:hypothetical protein